MVVYMGLRERELCCCGDEQGGMDAICSKMRKNTLNVKK